MASDFADRLQRWRVSKGFRQKEAAAVFDIPTGTYRTWEKGSRTPKPLTMAEVERRMADDWMPRMRLDGTPSAMDIILNHPKTFPKNMGDTHD